MELVNDLICISHVETYYELTGNKRSGLHYTGQLGEGSHESP
jgi:hypothetical protein